MNKRKCRFALHLAILCLAGVVTVFPIAFLEKTVSIQPIDYTFRRVAVPFIHDILNQNILLVLISTYFSPTLLYLGLYLTLPAFIIQLAFSKKYETSIQLSKRERLIQDKNFYSMVSSNLVVTGLELMLIGNNIYMFADTGSSEQK